MRASPSASLARPGWLHDRLRRLAWHWRSDPGRPTGSGSRAPEWYHDGCTCLPPAAAAAGAAGEEPSMPEPLVGAHMSIAGGIHRAFERAADAGCRTLQIFLKNSTRWEARALMDEDRLLYRQAQERTGIAPVLAHASYLINLASPETDLQRRSRAALAGELERANFLGVPCLILHPGSHMGDGAARALARVARALDDVLARVPPPVRILLENTAGQGTSLGARFEELTAILERTRQPERIGVCFDTCHAFAAGYDLSSAEAYRTTMRELDRRVGLERIGAIHVNDSREALGSRIDRHEHIGRGRIGLEGFRALMNDRRFAHIPKIIETPKGPDLRADRMNLAVLRRLISVTGYSTPKLRRQMKRRADPNFGVE